MALRRTIELAHAQVEVEERSGYLYVVETGQLRNMRELHAYTSAMDEVVAQTGIDRAVIDARGEVGDPPAEVRAAMWDWLGSPERGFSLVAFILPSEMAVARVNMTALSRRAPVRAFTSVQEAQRWLTRGPRATSSMFAPSAERISSRPPPRADANAPTERPPAATAPTVPAFPRPPAVPAEAAEPRSERVPRPSPPPRSSTPAPRGVDSARRPSDRGFRPPQPGPSERAHGNVSAEATRPVRESELRSRVVEPSAAPKRSPKGNGGSQVA